MKFMLELPEFDMERLLDAWQDAVFGLYLAEEKIEPEVVENMRSWEHSGFSVDQSRIRHQVRYFFVAPNIA